MIDSQLRILVGADAPADPNSGAAGTVFATNAALRELGHHVDTIWSEHLPHRIRHWNLHYLLELPKAYERVVQERISHTHYHVIQLSQPHAWRAARDNRRRRRRTLLVNRSHGLESMADAALAHWKPRLGAAESGFPRALFSGLLQRALHRHIDLVVRYADGIIVPAQDIRELLICRHAADPARIVVIPHGVPDEFIHTPRPLLTADRLRRILHVGQHSVIKGAPLMVAAIEAALSVDPTLSFTWVCGRDHHGAARALFRPEFHSRVIMQPWAVQSDLLELYDSHGVFVAHSVYEGAAKACTEAMARGLVLVSSAVGALKDHVQPGNNGYLVEVGDTEGMASRLLAACTDLDQSIRMGEQASLTMAPMSWRSCASTAVSYYERLQSMRG
jgi:glycosyltransferase involved in cell wall biosynthesis